MTKIWRCNLVIAAHAHCATLGPPRCVVTGWNVFGMSLFIIQNSRGEFLEKNMEWSAGIDANALFKTPHKDVALNQLVELNSKDFTLRAQVIPCETDEKGRPRLAMESNHHAA